MRSAAADTPDTEAGPLPTPVRMLAVAGSSDRPVTATARAEQAQLRQALLAGEDHAQCALCGRHFPARFLIAAHIKRRGACSEAERRMVHVAMLACTFGCDALYEDGFVTVDGSGRVVPGKDAALLDGTPALYVEGLTGRQCTVHSPKTEPFFAWHRSEAAGL